MSRWPTVIQNRTYMLLWGSQLASLVGDAVFNLAIIVHVYNVTGSALHVGTLMIFSLLPSLVVGSVAGVFIDRWPLKATLVGSDVVRALSVLGILLFRSLGPVYLLTFVMNASSRFFGPAYGSVVAAVVHPDLLQAANSFNVTTRRAVQLVLPALGGLLIARYSVASAFGLNAASFIASALVIAACRMPIVSNRGPGRATVRFGQEWLEGYRWVRDQRAVWGLLMAAVVLGLPVGVNNTLIVVFVERLLRLSVADFGYLMSALTAGVLLGGVVIGQLSPRLEVRFTAVAVGLGLAGLAFAIFAFNRSLTVALLLRIVMGLGFTIFNVAAYTTIQQLAPQALRGRVFTFYNAVDETASLLFMGLASVVADLVQVHWLFLCGGVAVLLASGCVWAFVASPERARSKARSAGRRPPGMGVSLEVQVPYSKNGLPKVRRPGSGGQLCSPVSPGV